MTLLKGNKIILKTTIRLYLSVLNWSRTVGSVCVELGRFCKIQGSVQDTSFLHKA